jgi:hypothetical protein
MREAARAFACLERLNHLAAKRFAVYSGAAAAGPECRPVGEGQACAAWGGTAPWARNLIIGATIIKFR